MYIIANLAFLLLSHNGSQPVSKYKDSFDAKIGMPVTILAAYSCTFSNLSVSEIAQPSYTTEAYSSIDLTKVTYIFDKFVSTQSKFEFLN